MKGNRENRTHREIRAEQAYRVHQNYKRIWDWQRFCDELADRFCPIIIIIALICGACFLGVAIREIGKDVMEGKAEKKVMRIRIARMKERCPKCKRDCARHSLGVRHLHEIGTSSATVLVITYSKHYCKNCRKHFSQSMNYLAPPSGRFSNRVIRTALSLVKQDMMTLKQASHHLRQEHHVSVPPTTISDWRVRELAV